MVHLPNRLNIFAIFAKNDNSVLWVVTTLFAGASLAVLALGLDILAILGFFFRATGMVLSLHKYDLNRNIDDYAIRGCYELSAGKEIWRA